MEVIHHVVNGLYPFNKEKDSEQIQAEYLFTLANSAQYEAVRAFSKKFKEVKCPHIIKLLKVLKEDQ